MIRSLIDKATLHPSKTIFRFLRDEEGVNDHITYGALLERVRRTSSLLEPFQGKPALLIYQDILEFIVGFLACQYAGVIPVPVPHIRKEKHLVKLKCIASDSNPAVALCCGDSMSFLKDSFLPGESLMLLLATDVNSFPAFKTPDEPVHHEIAFVQYTSGSTGNPKGVVVTHDNVTANLEMIKKAFEVDDKSVIFSWLPFHHDMGLIGSILQTIHCGCSCILMSPMSFLQNPARWLKGIAEYKATHSGGPNFAYDLCIDKITSQEIAGLDLTGWRVAYNGSEPVRPETVQRFTEFFRRTGFKLTCFYPCYGLAEATLLVSGRKSDPVPG